jgi:hypothetical protein
MFRVHERLHRTLRSVRIRRALVIVIAALLVGTAGCANPSYDEDAKRAELIRAGLTDAQAQCVTSEMAKEFEPPRLDAHAPATESEHAKMVAILDECDVNLSAEPALAAPS